MGYQSIFYDISNQLQHCLWLLHPVSDGSRQPDLGGTGVLLGGECLAPAVEGLKCC